MQARSYGKLIIGNGALGLFLARELVRRGHEDLAVAGDHSRAGGATQAAGAMFGCFSEVTTSTLAGPAGKEKFELGLEARRRWPETLESLRREADAATPLRTVADTYVVLNARGGELDSRNFDAMIDALDAYGEPWEEVEPRDIAAYSPRYDSRALRAVRIPEEGGVDARGVLDRVEAELRRAGVGMLDQVASLDVADDGAAGATLADGTRARADRTIVAAGAASADILEPALDAHEMMPMFAGLGVSIVGKRTRGPHFRSVVRTPNRAFGCGLHLVPLGAGREYLGATNVVVSPAQTSAFVGDVNFLTECAMSQLDEEIYHHQVQDWRVGNRPVALDGFPLIGWVREPGLYVATGTYRDGFHCAPAIAAHVADQLEGSEGHLAGTFAPTRSPIATRSVAESIDDFVEHRLAAWFEAGAQAPPNTSTSALAQILRDQATAFYDKLGIDFGLSPDVLMHVIASLRSPHTSAALRYIADEAERSSV